MYVINIYKNQLCFGYASEWMPHTSTHTQRASSVQACYKHPSSFSDYRWNCSRMKEMNDENGKASLHRDRIWNNEFSKWRIFSRPLFDLALTWWWSCLRLMACSGLDERYECTTFGSHKICVLCTECNIKWTAYGFKVDVFATVSLRAKRSLDKVQKSKCFKMANNSELNNFRIEKSASSKWKSQHNPNAWKIEHVKSGNLFWINLTDTDWMRKISKPWMHSRLGISLAWLTLQNDTMLNMLLIFHKLTIANLGLSEPKEEK